MNSTNKTRTLVGCAMLGTVAAILMYFQIAVPFMPSFIKLDVSDLPALIGAFAYGPVSGIVISALKNVLHIIIEGTSTGFVGELSNFLLASFFTAPAGFIYQKNKTKTGAIIACAVGAVIMGVCSYFSNLYLVYPVYYNFMPKEVILSAYQAINPKVDSIGQCLLIFNVPFTMLKGILTSVVCMIVYKPLSPILKGRK